MLTGLRHSKYLQNPSKCFSLILIAGACDGIMNKEVQSSTNDAPVKSLMSPVCLQVKSIFYLCAGVEYPLYTIQVRIGPVIKVLFFFEKNLELHAVYHSSSNILCCMQRTHTQSSDRYRTSLVQFC